MLLRRCLAPSTPASIFHLPAFISLTAVLITLLLPAFDCHATTANQFFQLTVYATGGTPVKIVTADFNRDGKPDVVALNSNNVLSILLGSGNAFAASKTIAALPANTASSAVRLAAGDFNGDGNQDVLVMPSPGNLVKVFLGHGDGTFASPVSIADGLPSAGDLAVGDFNGDDKTDIAVASATSVAVMLGKSSGIFATPIVTKTNLSAPDHLVLAIGDVNRDSHLDIAANDTFGSFQVLLGKGTGSFNVKPVFSFAPSLADPLQTGLAIADFSGDGNPDIAVSNGADQSVFLLGQVCLLPGYGDGTFDLNSAACSMAPYSFGEMLVANLNGKPDLFFSSDPMMVKFNNGSGVLTQSNYAVGGGPVAVGDFNGDGRQDVVAGTPGGVQVMFNGGAGVLRAPLSISDVAGPWTQSMIMNSTDFNGDGYADLAALGYFDEHGYIQPQVDVVLGGATNLFTKSATFCCGFYSLDSSGFVSSGPPAIGDFNHDGYLDIAIGATGTVLNDNGDSQPYVQVFFADGKGHFPTAGPVLDMNSNFFAAGDFNGDGKADLASLDGSAFEILIGKGDGTFAPPVTYAVGANPMFVLKRDLNGDGKMDVIVVNQDGNDVSVLLGKGDGTFLPQKTFAAGKAPVAVLTGDFNRDGKIDIAVASSAGVSVLLGNGNGTFQPQKTYSATGPMTGFVEASVRQDGIEDIMGIDSASQRFVLLPGAGNGTFGAAVVYPLDRVPTQIVAGDFNHDGATDLAFMGSGSIAVFYNQGGDHVTLASSLSKPKVNQSVTFTARVALSFGETGTPTGKVTFKDGTRYLGNVAIKAGTASLSTSLAAGTHSIVAQYSGDSNFNPNHSATITIVAAP